jgi:hypothetical protein
MAASTVYEHALRSVALPRFPVCRRLLAKSWNTAAQIERTGRRSTGDDVAISKVRVF